MIALGILLQVAPPGPSIVAFGVVVLVLLALSAARVAAHRAPRGRWPGARRRTWGERPSP